MAVANTLAYYDTAKITAVKRYIVQASEGSNLRYHNKKTDIREALLKGKDLYD